MTEARDLMLGSFVSAPDRLTGELAEREAMAARAMPYGVPFLDDALRGILPHDLVLLGAPSGVGKTDLAVAIAGKNARSKRRVGFFALEAEPREIERRIKYGMLVERLLDVRHAEVGSMNYADWMLGRCERMCGPFNAEVDAAVRDQLGSLRTFYRGQRFDAADLKLAMERARGEIELFVIDHAHYIDGDDANENRGLTETVKLIRDTSLLLGVPVVLVAHLRKRDPRLKQLVPSLDDFHGSSNLAKVCTHAITIEPARSVEIAGARWHDAMTFIAILKDRRMGAPSQIALSRFDRRMRRYDGTYTLGNVRDGGTSWEPLRPGDAPSWAKAHRAIETKPRG